MERWELEEKLRKCAWRVGLISVGALLLFGLLWFIASHSRGTTYDPFVESCDRMSRESSPKASPLGQ